MWTVSFDMFWLGSSKQLTWENVLQLTTMDFDGDHQLPQCKANRLVPAVIQQSEGLAWAKIGPAEYLKNKSELCAGLAIPAVYVFTVPKPYRKVIRFNYQRSEKTSKTSGTWDAAKHVDKERL